MWKSVIALLPAGAEHSGYCVYFVSMSAICLCVCVCAPVCRAVTVPLIPFPVRFGSVFQQKPRFGSVFSYLLNLNRESTNAVNGNINLGYTYISKLLW